MQVLIRVEGEVDGRGLMHWLHADPVSKQAELSTVAGDSGQMGTGEIVQAVMENSIALGGLVVAVSTWWDARRRRPGSPPVQVVIERDGISTTVTGADPAHIQRIVEALTSDDSEGDDLDLPR